MSKETNPVDPIPQMLEGAFQYITGPGCLNDSTLAPEKGQGLYSLQFMYKNMAEKDVAGLLQQAEKRIAPVQATCNPPQGAPVWITVFVDAKRVAEHRAEEVAKTRTGVNTELAVSLVHAALTCQG